MQEAPAELPCPHCAYGLEGSTSNRCPECGAVVDRAALLERLETRHLRVVPTATLPLLLVGFLVLPLLFVGLVVVVASGGSDIPLAFAFPWAVIAGSLLDRGIWGLTMLIVGVLQGPAYGLFFALRLPPSAYPRSWRGAIGLHIAAVVVACAFALGR